MNEKEFCYWLQGFIELTGELEDGLTAEQTEMVKEHLHLVFTKVTPPMGGSGGSEVELEESLSFDIACDNLHLTCSAGDNNNILGLSPEEMNKIEEQVEELKGWSNSEEGKKAIKEASDRSKEDIRRRKRERERHPYRRGGPFDRYCHVRYC